MPPLTLLVQMTRLQEDNTASDYIEAFGSLNLGEDHLSTAPTPTFSKEGLEELLTSLTPWAEKNHGRHAVHITTFAKIFSCCSTTPWNLQQSYPAVNNATGGSMQNPLAWRSQMEANIQNQNHGLSDTIANEAMNKNRDPGTVLRLTRPQTDQGEVVHYEHDERADHLEASEESIPPANPSQLKPDQRRAYDIVTWHLDQTLSGAQPPLLRIILYGEGGTAKGLRECTHELLGSTVASTRKVKIQTWILM
ncbi:hypothetical protein H0H92_007062, partial [Tricholoma furcatifolium]